jgi:uncharacterized membrane protein
MRRQFRNLLAVMVIAVLSAVLALVMPADSIVRMIFALPLVFFLPGYAITAALLPMNSFRTTERLLFSLGLSVAATALSGLMLNLTDWGLQSKTWAITLAGIVLLAGAIAWLRSKPKAPVTPVPVKKYFKLSFRDLVLLWLAVVVMGVAVGLTRLPVAPNGVSGYTQLWMLPATPGNSNNFHLGINSEEFTETRYRLQVKVDGQVVQEWPQLSLKPGETWETAIKLQSDRSGSGSIEADLYNLDDPGTLYRHVKLWSGG